MFLRKDSPGQAKPANLQLKKHKYHPVKSNTNFFHILTENFR